MTKLRQFGGEGKENYKGSSTGGCSELFRDKKTYPRKRIKLWHQLKLAKTICLQGYL